ncbi:MAG: hypothetical protein QXO86_05535 [Nitrososphaerota archaeon]
MQETGQGESYEIEVEVQLTPAARVRVRSVVGASKLREAIEAAQKLVSELLPTSHPIMEDAARRFPQDLLAHLGSLKYRDLALLLTYFEGPLTREQINQRSRELGKEVSKDWLDTEFFRRPYKDYFVAEADASGAKVYRLSEKGKMQAEEILRRLR